MKAPDFTEDCRSALPRPCRLSYVIRIGIALVSLSLAAHAQALAPRPGIWVAYQPFWEMWERGAPGDEGNMLVTAGHGRPPLFSISVTGNGLRRANVRTPGNLDGFDLQASPPELPNSKPRNGFERGENELERLDLAVDHHRPPIAIMRSSQGFRRVTSNQVDRYNECARRLLITSAEGIAAMANNADQHRAAGRALEWRNREFRSPANGAILLLQLMSLRLPSAENGRLTQNARRRNSEHDAGEQLRQHSMRDPLILQHGQEFEQHIDLMADRASPRARTCLMVPLQRLREAQTDRCRISSVVDRRDGWPLFISVFRERTAASGATEGRVDFFSRIVPLEGFVPPPNPCPTS